MSESAMDRAVREAFDRLSRHLNGRREVGWLACGTPRFDDDTTEEIEAGVTDVLRAIFRRAVEIVIPELEKSPSCSACLQKAAALKELIGE